jgi:hypothetical protein
MPMKQGYWFPAKRYGWGWGFPVTWQGWTIFGLWFAVVLGAGISLMPRMLALFLVVVTVATALLVLVCHLKGEPPVWRWGDKV